MKNFEEKLEALFLKMKSGSSRFLDFQEVSTPYANRFQLRERESTLQLQEKCKIFDNNQVFNSVFFHKPDVGTLF